MTDVVVLLAAAAGGGERALSLANEAQFLLINAASVQHLLLEMERGGDEPTPGENPPSGGH